MRVRATMAGYFDHARRRVGDVFTIPDVPRRILFPAEKKAGFETMEQFAVVFDKDGQVPQLFSFRWMEPVGEDVRETISTSTQAMAAKSEEIKLEKAAARSSAAPGSADVI